jgi:hypothetical protein
LISYPNYDILSNYKFTDQIIYTPSDLRDMGQEHENSKIAALYLLYGETKLKGDVDLLNDMDRHVDLAKAIRESNASMQIMAEGDEEDQEEQKKKKVNKLFRKIRKLELPEFLDFENNFEEVGDALV